VSNQSSVTALYVGVSEHHDISDFIDKDGLSLAILMPKGVKPGIDWGATSFAVSTECFPLRNNSCQLSTMSDVNFGVNYPFSCSSTEPELNISGVLYSWTTQMRYYNWHRYIEEPRPFDATNLPPNNESLRDWKQMAKNIKDDEAGHVFSNPWQMLSALMRSYVEASDTIKSDDDQLIFDRQQVLLAYCNNTGSY
jgi:hypothetical protein